MESSGNGFYYGNRARFIVLILSTACLTMTYCNSLALNFTIICMNDVTMAAREDGMGENQTAIEEHWLESSAHKNMLFSAIAVGTLLGTFPFIKSMSSFGSRKTYAVFGFVSAIGTIFLPLAVDLGGFWPAMCMRVLQGFALAMNFPACGEICQQWSTMRQSGMFIAILSCHLQFSAMFTMPVAGALCESSLGWRSLYYLQGVMTIAFFAVFFIFYEDTPAIHRKVSSKELSRIQEGKSIQSERQPVPYTAIMRSRPIIGVWIASLGGNLGFNIFLQYGPIYMNKVLGFEVASTGFATALPFMLSFFTKLIAGSLSDHITFLSEKWKVIFFASMSQGAMALCIIGLAITNDVTFAQVCYTAAIACSGLNVVGLIKGAQHVSRQHIHFVMSVISFINCLIVLVMPAGVALIAADNTPGQWSIIWYGVAVVVIVANSYFLCVIDAEAAEWTKENYGNKVKDVDVYMAPNRLGSLEDLEGMKSNVSIQRLENIVKVDNPKVY